MEKGQSDITRYLLRSLGKEKMAEIEMYIADILERNFLSLSNEEEVSQLFGQLASDFTSSLTYQEALNLRSYTGFSHKEINAIMRNKWNYEEHGRLTEEKHAEYSKLGSEVEKIIFKFAPLEQNLITYRGVTLAQFRDYGIHYLEDLPSMVGNYFYDAGFSSTSLVRDSSLYDTEAFQIGKRNIEIEYYIPEECHDGALLLDEYTSHYKAENEYLINCGSLIKVLSVDIDKEKNTAFIRAALVPKKIWDPMAVKHLEENQSIKK